MKSFASVAYALFLIILGLKDSLGELPRREASLFREQVSSSFSRSQKIKALKLIIMKTTNKNDLLQL